MPPHVAPQTLSEINVLPCADDDAPATALCHQSRDRVKGGEVGKCPPTPEPTSMVVQGSAAYPAMLEELDTGDSEGKTKMSFAKMTIPQEYREKFTLGDEDFAICQTEKEEVESTVVVSEENTECEKFFESEDAESQQPKEVETPKSRSQTPSELGGKKKRGSSTSTSASPSPGKRKSMHRTSSHEKMSKTNNNNGKHTLAPLTRQLSNNMNDQAAQLGLY